MHWIFSIKCAYAVLISLKVFADLLENQEKHHMVNLLIYLLYITMHIGLTISRSRLKKAFGIAVVSAFPMFLIIHFYVLARNFKFAKENGNNQYDFC